MLGPAPSASGEPSIWCAAVAAPHRKPLGKTNGSDAWVIGAEAWLGWIGMKTVTWQDSRRRRQMHRRQSQAPHCITSRRRQGQPGEFMAKVTLDRLRKVYPNGYVGVDDATFEIG